MAEERKRSGSVSGMLLKFSKKAPTNETPETTYMGAFIDGTHRRDVIKAIVYAKVFIDLVSQALNTINKLDVSIITESIGRLQQDINKLIAEAYTNCVASKNFSVQHVLKGKRKELIENIDRELKRHPDLMKFFQGTDLHSNLINQLKNLNEDKHFGNQDGMKKFYTQINILYFALGGSGRNFGDGNGSFAPLTFTEEHFNDAIGMVKPAIETKIQDRLETQSLQEIKKAEAKLQAELDARFKANKYAIKAEIKAEYGEDNPIISYINVNNRLPNKGFLKSEWDNNKSTDVQIKTNRDDITFKYEKNIDPYFKTRPAFEKKTEYDEAIKNAGEGSIFINFRDTNKGGYTDDDITKMETFVAKLKEDYELEKPAQVNEEQHRKVGLE